MIVVNEEERERGRDQERKKPGEGEIRSRSMMNVGYMFDRVFFLGQVVVT